MNPVRLPIADCREPIGMRLQPHSSNWLTGVGDGTVDDRSMRTESWQLAIGNVLNWQSFLGAFFRDANNAVPYQQFDGRTSASSLGPDDPGGNAVLFALH